MTDLVAGPGPPAGHVYIRLDICWRDRCVHKVETDCGLCERHAAQLRDKEKHDG